MLGTVPSFITLVQKFAGPSSKKFYGHAKFGAILTTSNFDDEYLWNG